MYQIAIFKIRPEPDSIRYQTTIWLEPDIRILVALRMFMLFCVVWMRKV